MDLKIEAPELVNETLNPLAKGIGNTLRSIWNITFGWIDCSDQKLQAKRLKELDQFKEALNSEVSKIPSENLTEPPLSIIGPALEASKYYFEDDVLRKMFAKLIANSMNSDYKQYINNSFVEIIKQMSPVDAANISFLNKWTLYPVCQFTKENIKNNGFDIIYPLIFLKNTDNEECITENAVSIYNLQRLGLVEFNFTFFFAGPERYNQIKNLSISTYIDPITNESRPYDIKNGFVSITPLGKNFTRACL